MATQALGSDRIRFVLLGRTVTLFRRDDAASYFLCVYIREEKRQYRKSLKTPDPDVARQRAEREVFELLGRVERGEKLLDKRINDAFRDFDAELTRQQVARELSTRTVSLNRSRIEKGRRFIRESIDGGLDGRLSSFDGGVFDEYLRWRDCYAESQGRKIPRRDVVRDELLSIRKVFKFAHRQKHCSEDAIPRWSFRVEASAATRQRMVYEDYTYLQRGIKRYIGRQPKNFPDRVYGAQMLRHVILLIANTGMRTGEVFGLKNRDVKLIRAEDVCSLRIRAETSKVRRERLLHVGSSDGSAPKGRSVNYLIRWVDQHQIHKSPEDFVFSGFKGGGVDGRDTFYHQFKRLREVLSTLDRDVSWLDPYHCRHFWITMRLYAGEPIHSVAKVAGTSTSEIEQTYSHVLTELESKRMAKRRARRTDEGVFVIHDEQED